MIQKLAKLVNITFRAMDQNVLYRPCNVGTAKIENFETKWPKQYKGIQCNFWMSEQPIALSTSHHAYTIIRSPKEHVISQYFHCTEAPVHRGKHLMPPLDEWLDYYIGKKRKYGVKGAFNCYNPINLQSYFTDFAENVTEDELYKRFDIIGIMEDFDKSICAVSIRYMGYVPPMCDCTPKKANNTRKLNADHGVIHHGATFKLTNGQADKIANLTKLDSLLYESAKIVFARQIKEIEEEFDIILCDDPDFGTL